MVELTVVCLDREAGFEKTRSVEHSSTYQEPDADESGTCSRRFTRCSFKDMIAAKGRFHLTGSPSVLHTPATHRMSKHTKQGSQGRGPSGSQMGSSVNVSPSPC